MLPDSPLLILETFLWDYPPNCRFKNFYDEQRLKIIKNVGYEQPVFSHFRSMDIWQSARFDEFLNSGWIGPLSNPNTQTGQHLPKPELPRSIINRIGWRWFVVLFTGNQSFTIF
ncbi:MAG: hypothetical protein CM15mP83_8840 [Flavobacteriaceae bacterium]|nr:MAG: hypothetical protein CM15mP83_8840 [Flavobacteriaceae bacterium]